jgi:hypothetical protein
LALSTLSLRVIGLKVLVSFLLPPLFVCCEGEKRREKKNINHFSRESQGIVGADVEAKEERERERGREGERG